MYNDRPSAKHMVLTLAGWAVGLLAVAGVMVAISTAMAPKTPSDKLPAAVETTATATAAVVATMVAPPVATPTVPAPTPAPAAKRSSASTKPLAGKVVVIDAGHQAFGDSSVEPIGPGSPTRKAKVSGGASGVTTHNAESLVNLQVARRLQEELVSRGAKVVMVRTKQAVNISNSKRASIANNAHADLFIRLHCDGNSDRSLSGLSTLVPGANKWTKPIVAKSKKAGVFIHDAVISETGAVDRGVVTRNDLSGFNWSKVPTVLVEMGFLSNPAEDVKLSTMAYQLSLATGLANGIEKYLTAK